MLHAQELPEEGGDTLFADMHKAWDSLPEALRKAIEGRTAAHSYTARYSEPRFEGNWRPTLSAAQLAEVREVVHPIVRTHPESGRKALFVSEGFTTRIVGLPADERPTARRAVCAQRAPRASTGIAGRRMTWCSGTTAR